MKVLAAAELAELWPGLWAASMAQRLSVSASFCCIFTYSCLSRARCFCSLATSSAPHQGDKSGLTPNRHHSFWMQRKLDYLPQIKCIRPDLTNFSGIYFWEKKNKWKIFSALRRKCVSYRLYPKWFLWKSIFFGMKNTFWLPHKIESQLKDSVGPTSFL